MDERAVILVDRRPFEIDVQSVEMVLVQIRGDLADEIRPFRVADQVEVARVECLVPGCSSAANREQNLHMIRMGVGDQVVVLAAEREVHLHH